MHGHPTGVLSVLLTTKTCWRLQATKLSGLTNFEAKTLEFWPGQPIIRHLLAQPWRSYHVWCLLYSYFFGGLERRKDGTGNCAVAGPTDGVKCTLYDPCRLN